MMIHLRRLLPPVVLALLLSLTFVLPDSPELLPSAVSPDMPLGTDLPGWYGSKTQESEMERAILSKRASIGCAASTVDIPIPGRMMGESGRMHLCLLK